MKSTKNGFLAVTITKTLDGRFNTAVFEEHGGTTSPSHLHPTLIEAMAWVEDRYVRVLDPKVLSSYLVGDRLSVRLVGTGTPWLRDHSGVVLDGTVILENRYLISLSFSPDDGPLVLDDHDVEVVRKIC
jgi:hypothetical protein